MWAIAAEHWPDFEWSAEYLGLPLQTVADVSIAAAGILFLHWSGHGSAGERRTAPRQDEKLTSQ